MTYEEIAGVAHEVNRTYCLLTGDNSQKPWEDAPEWQKTSAINGVKFHATYPNVHPSDSHNNWLKEKEANGWKFGEVKNAEKKEHPCFLPYNELPRKEKAKDIIFKAVVEALLAKDGNKEPDKFYDLHA